MEARELLKKALSLPDNERAELAGTLLESLDTTIDEDADAAWQNEIVHRMEEIQSGKLTASPWSAVHRRPGYWKVRT